MKFLDVAVTVAFFAQERWILSIFNENKKCYL